MMLESTLLEEKSRRETRPSISHQRSRDSSLKRDSEGRDFTREKRLTSTSKTRKIRQSMIRFSPSTSRNKKHITMLPRRVKKRKSSQRKPRKLNQNPRLLPPKPLIPRKLLPQLSKLNKLNPPLKLPLLKSKPKPSQHNKNQLNQSKLPQLNKPLRRNDLIDFYSKVLYLC